MNDEKSCAEEMERRKKENDYPTCPKCGAVASHHMMSCSGDYDKALGRKIQWVVFTCGNCTDPHENQWAGHFDGPTQFAIRNGEKVLVTPGPSEFA